MSNNKDSVTRTGISLEQELLMEFDKWLESKGFPNRSEGIRFLIREKLGKEILVDNPETLVVGSLTYIFEHHKFDSGLKLVELQHDFGELIISTMHAHITHDLCLETVFLRGKQVRVKELAEKVLALKGVLNGKVYLLPAK